MKTIYQIILVLFIAINSLTAAPFQVHENFPSKIDILYFADLISQYSLRKNGKFKHNTARALEHLLYSRNFIQNKLMVQRIHEKSFGKNKIVIDRQDKSLLFDNKKYKLSLTTDSSNIYSNYIPHKKNSPAKAVLEKNLLGPEYSKTIITQIYQQISKTKGLDPFIPENYKLIQILDEDLKLQKTSQEEKELFFQVREKVKIDKDSTTKWQYIPIRLVSKPVTKVMYEVPQAVLSVPVEGVTRSPWHNLVGSMREFETGFKSIPQNFKEIGHGIAKPKKGLVVEGLTGFADTGVTFFKAGLGLVKTGLSIVAYPIYRLFGGKRSLLARKKGKRAAIILVDAATGSGLFNNIMDIFGEEIARGQLKGYIQYFCVESSAKDTDIKKCIDEIPDKIDYVDFFALTHTGGTSQIERYAEYAIKMKGLKPEVMLSIGCYDRDPNLTHPKDSVGQKHTSWAVHYYLSSLISKRIRGIPVEQAAYQSFYEGLPLNMVNPISLGGMIAVGAMEQDLKLGYWGSMPDSNDNQKKILNKLLDDNWRKFDRSYSSYKRKRQNAPSKEEMNESLKSIHNLNEYLKVNKKYLSRKTKKNLKKSMKKYTQVTSELSAT
ncbi:hypothetical protein N9N67_01820 [Bacteriovoracaceae bacterium]|nr:hypothetical protein [Bacteriovoracaceae bacterium]